MRVLLIVMLGAGTARADDGYCDFVEGVASAESALLFAPEVFGEFGRIEQASSSVQPGAQPGGLRLIGGLRYRLTGLYEGAAVKSRATAECRRHQALEQIRGETLYRALDARAQVIDGALGEAEKMLATVTADLAERRTTAQEATAMRLRLEELRRISTDTRQAMTALPRPSGGTGGLAAFQRADNDVEANDAKIRRAKAIDVSVRFGIDDYLDSANDTSSPYFAVVSLGVNLGAFFQGSGNSRAADGRRRYVRSGRDPLSVDATADRLRALAAAAAKRAEETAALEADLARQIEALAKVGGDDTRRYRQTVWFDWIKIRAEHAYHAAHVAALAQVLGS